MSDFTQGSFVEWSRGYKSDIDDYFFRGLAADNPDNATGVDRTANHGWLHEKDFKENNGFPDWVTAKDKQAFLSFIGESQKRMGCLRISTQSGYSY